MLWMYNIHGMTESMYQYLKQEDEYAEHQTIYYFDLFPCCLLYHSGIAKSVTACLSILSSIFFTNREENIICWDKWCQTETNEQNHNSKHIKIKKAKIKKKQYMALQPVTQGMLAMYPNHKALKTDSRCFLFINDVHSCKIISYSFGHFCSDKKELLLHLSWLLNELLLTKYVFLLWKL